jgi:hypothetical protein
VRFHTKALGGAIVAWHVSASAAAQITEITTPPSL